MEVKGYKAFNKDKTNRYGVSFIEGESYHTDNSIRFSKSGFHMCKHLSDVFRYFDSGNFCVAEVIGYGNIDCEDLDDWDPPYYDMYAVSDIKIVKFLTREDIINIMLNSSSNDVIKFVQTFKLSYEEAILFVDRFINDKRVLKTILYYVFNYDKAYSLPYGKETELSRELIKLI